MVGILDIFDEWMDKHRCISLPHMCGSILIVYSAQIWHCLDYCTFDIKSLHIWLGKFPIPSALTLYLDFLQVSWLLLFICWSKYSLESVCQNYIGILISNLWINLGGIYIFIVLGLLMYDYVASSVSERAWMRIHICQPSPPVLLASVELCVPDCTCRMALELNLLSVIITS